MLSGASKNSHSILLSMLEFVLTLTASSSNFELQVVNGSFVFLGVVMPAFTESSTGWYMEFANVLMLPSYKEANVMMRA